LDRHNFQSEGLDIFSEVENFLVFYTLRPVVVRIVFVRVEIVHGNTSVALVNDSLVLISVGIILVHTTSVSPGKGIGSRWLDDKRFRYVPLVVIRVGGPSVAKDLYG
jgi:hypothetical protein